MLIGILQRYLQILQSLMARHICMLFDLHKILQSAFGIFSLKCTERLKLS